MNRITPKEFRRVFWECLIVSIICALLNGILWLMFAFGGFLKVDTFVSITLVICIVGGLYNAVRMFITHLKRWNDFSLDGKTMMILEYGLGIFCAMWYAAFITWENYIVAYAILTLSIFVGLILTTFFMFMDGKHEDNEYGPNPYKIMN